MENFSERDLLAVEPKLRRYSRSLIKDKSDAEDLLQDVLVRAIEKQHLFIPGGNLMGWTGRMMRNLFIEQIRKTARRFTVETRPCNSDKPQPEYADPTQQTDINVILRDIVGAVQSLPQIHKEAIKLVYYDGLPFTEAAKVTGIPFNTMYTRAFRAKATLRSKLA